MLKTRKIGMTRLAKMLYLFFAAVIVCNLFATAVAAANVSDTRHRDQGYLTNGSLTNFRAKDDDSSCYVYNDASSCTVSTLVYGSNYITGANKVNDSYYSYGISIRVGEEKGVYNLVYERDHRYAALWFWTPDSSQYEYIDLLWSPDCTGSVCQ